MKNCRQLAYWSLVVWLGAVHAGCARCQSRIVNREVPAAYPVLTSHGLAAFSVYIDASGKASVHISEISFRGADAGLKKLSAAFADGHETTLDLTSATPMRAGGPRGNRGPWLASEIWARGNIALCHRGSRLDSIVCEHEGQTETIPLLWKAEQYGAAFPAAEMPGFGLGGIVQQKDGTSFGWICCPDDATDRDPSYAVTIALTDGSSIDVDQRAFAARKEAGAVLLKWRWASPHKDAELAKVVVRTRDGKVIWIGVIVSWAVG
jgi:hypothetical protein